MRRIRFIVVSILGCAIVSWPLWMLATTEGVRWSGGFDLTVHVVSSETSPKSVTCEAWGNREYALQSVTEFLPPESKTYSVIADPFSDKPLTVKVPLRGSDSKLGFELRRMQYRHLAVVATMADGRRVGKVVDIPDCRTAPRPITVQVVLP